jgi:hypothetical protein
MPAWLCLKNLSSGFSRPRSGRNENSPALQRWVKGDGITSSPRSGRQDSGGDHQTANVCRPFHGLAIVFFILIPALKRWAILTSSAIADELLRLFGQSLSALAARKFIAILLPATFFWAFVACTVICTRDCSELLSSSGVASAVGLTHVKDLSDCSGCPFGLSPKASTPQRLTLTFNSEASAVLPQLPSVCATDHSALNNPRTRPSTAVSPPLELFRTLRL